MFREDREKPASIDSNVPTRSAYEMLSNTIAYLIHSQELPGRIRAEVAPAVYIDGETVNLKYLTEKCPRLEALDLFNEVLRVNSADALAHEVIAPILFDGKMLLEGTKFMISYCQLHLDEAVWGPSTTLTLTWKDFLGIKAFHAIRVFDHSEVALLFGRYEVAFDTDATNREFPYLDDRTAGLGTMAAMPGPDIKLVI
ncbi:hypothetical protein SBOR_0056 [Sclerotinia borealis F-4128]|uniref:Uncharacterized protein n=1 Tax=Sclerotinia borealis (strain F-4128) TaxID=1432307 RepID=W9CUC3_SCLBF|nr:hypothetical protein SBOR_0056 [Sclerotinia borealis F-4128]